MQNNANNLINYTENHLLWERTLNICYNITQIFTSKYNFVCNKYS